MKTLLKIAIIIIYIIGISGYGNADGAKKNMSGAGYKELKIKLEDDTNVEVAFFSGKDDHAVVFVPGGSGVKENYYFIAKDLQKLGISSLALAGRNESHILSALEFLKKKGVKKFSLAGGSIGAATILVTIKYTLDETQRKSVDKVILIGPYGGSALKSDKIKKLFIASKKDSLSPYTGARNLFQETSEPKTLKVYDGSEHAEQLFASRHREDIKRLIIDFLKQNSN
ncbi:MAG: hypothetical protein KJO26_12630 [Deltaproteobacteria bacterium]|nr:hypothetical protein [Deltaproteobacteria bacterium]